MDNVLLFTGLVSLGDLINICLPTSMSTSVSISSTFYNIPIGFSSIMFMYIIIVILAGNPIHQ